MAQGSSASKAKAMAARLAQGVRRHPKVREIKARLADLVDAATGWLAPGWAGPDLQPVRIRSDRPRR